ncbi:hypothetical protein [Thioflexithrix psekupsensis]|uniref:Uncharacterized protein n=1 Tax=Thioflexithrix psekupsensis TaxID=1570016 RepID=A0A251X7T9_9GAMM|nr:hypothetical protein [Thioflexithrix psekupsensis]OUD13797.1 hypothetical protein TPSD3_05440 [Thioflexithrix psekupsensis]
MTMNIRRKRWIALVVGIAVLILSIAMAWFIWQGSERDPKNDPPPAQLPSFGSVWTDPKGEFHAIPYFDLYQN